MSDGEDYFYEFVFEDLESGNIVRVNCNGIMCADTKTTNDLKLSLMGNNI